MACGTPLIRAARPRCSDLGPDSVGRVFICRNNTSLEIDLVWPTCSTLFTTHYSPLTHEATTGRHPFAAARQNPLNSIRFLAVPRILLK
jgi:hypothetical protein